MLFKKNEVLGSITVEGTVNADQDLFRKVVDLYVSDLNKIRKENMEENMEERKRIKVEFGS